MDATHKAKSLRRRALSRRRAPLDDVQAGVWYLVLLCVALFVALIIFYG